MRTFVALTAASLLAFPASAQMTNCTTTGMTTNCMGSDGALTNCNTVGVSTQCMRMGGPATAQTTSETGGGQGAAQGMANFIHSLNVRRARARTLKALQANDCATARGQSFKTGDLEFARQVQVYCKGQ